jgi:hypothetical protein
MRVIALNDNLALDIPSGHFYHEVAKHMPKRRWLPARKLWEFPAIKPVMEYVHRNMSQLSWEDAAMKRWLAAVEREKDRKAVAAGQVDTSDPLDNVPFKFRPYEHQREALVLGRDRDVFAYLMDQGTGKTKVLLDDAAHNWRMGRIDAMLIIAPNSVKTNWCNMYEGDDLDEFDEVRKHMPPDVPFLRAAFFSNPNMGQRDAWDKMWKHRSNKSKFLIASFNVEGFHSQKAIAAVKEFTKFRKCMIVVDESTRIGNKDATRTKHITELRKSCPIARIASGTPIIKSPLKAFSQFGFLDPDILGIATYTEFAARYSVQVQLGDGSKAKVAARFINVDELSDKIAGVSFRILKEDCLDLPPKTYLKRNVQMSKVMEVAYKEMRDQSIIYLDSLHKVEATTVLTQLLRLQQITAGYLPVIDPETGVQTGVRPLNNGAPPKIEEAADLIEECESKVIVWCKFRFEILEMQRELERRGISCVTFYGDTPEAERVANRMRFQNDPSLRVFIGQVRTGGIGITLTAADTVIYLSNTFSTEDRVQSEDRAHRIGQTKPVTYYDLLSPRTIDIRVLNVLRANKRLSDEIMRDGYRAWV